MSSNCYIFFSLSVILRTMKPINECSLVMSEHPLVIKKECVHSLSDCLNALSKTQLLMIVAEVFPLSFNASKYTKVKLIPIIQTEIHRRILYAFKYFYPFVSAFFIGFVFKDKLTNILAHFKELEKARISRQEAEIIAAQLLMENGFCFAFLPKGKRTVQYVIPDELHTIAAQMAEKLASEDTQPIARNDFLLYANVLTSLYGICPVDLFMNIYNRDTRHPITDRQAFLWHMEEAASMSNDCYFTDNSMVSNYIFYDDYDEQKQALAQCRENFHPYIPSEEEILKKLFISSYDADTQAYKQCFDWLTQHAVGEYEAKTMVEIICAYISIDLTINEQLDFVRTYNDALGSVSADEFNRLLAILIELNNSCHRWTLWGHTSDEFFEETREKPKLPVIAETPGNSDHEAQAIQTGNHRLLPEGCRIPSEEEYKNRRKLFDDYGNYGGDRLPWLSTSRTQIRRIESSYKKITRIFDEMPNDSPEELIEQWLASIWHNKANRGGMFGNQQWNYAVFAPLEKLDENIFLCKGHDGKPFVVYSSAINTCYGDFLTCMSVLIDMGGWYILYGPVVFWKALFIFDFITLAKQIAPQMYEEQGLTAVIQFNPCPFWATTYLAHELPIVHGNTIIIDCSLECTFKHNALPELPKTWAMEQSGNYTRWIYNKSDYLNSRRIYYNDKTHEVFLSAHNEDAFNKLLKTLKKNIEQGKYEVKKMSMTMSKFFYGVLKYPHKLAQLEKKFAE